MFGLPLPWDPFSNLASQAAKIVAQGWVSLMLAFWNAGLWLLRVVMNFMDAFLVPDLSETGPGAQVYKTTFWIGGTLMLILLMVQLGVTAIQRDGKSLSRVLIGTAQFAMVWVGILTYTVTLVAAAGGLTTSLMESLLNVTKWSQWQPWQTFEVKDITDAVLATVLGVMGLFLVLAAIGHFFVMITRGAALMILVATSPIAAAGLVSDLGRSWFWKTFRWLHAAAFTPPLIVLVMGIGVQMAGGVAIGSASGVETSVGTAFPAVMLICGSVVSPVALFKLLSFVEPGTATGAAMRTGWAASGGLQGLLSGGGRGSSAASAQSSDGRSSGEQSAEDAQAARVGGEMASGARRLGPVGAAIGAGIGAMMGAGQAAVAIGSDLTNQMGVGHNSYYPDFTAGGRGNGAAQGNGSPQSDAGRGDEGSGASRGPSPEGGSSDSTPPSSTPPSSPTVATPLGAAGSGGTSGAGQSQAPSGAAPSMSGAPTRQGGADPTSQIPAPSAGASPTTTTPKPAGPPSTSAGGPSAGSSGAAVGAEATEVAEVAVVLL